MKLNTMAAVMSFVSKIENDSSSFYELHAERYPELKGTFLAWAKENKKFEKMVKQTYFGVITDTIEACYSFEGLDSDDYVLDMGLSENADSSEMTKTALEVEMKMKNFYAKAAKMSDSLMADIPRLFRKIVKKREERVASLASQSNA